MMGNASHRETKLFYIGVNLEDRMPQKHPLRDVAGAVDFSFVRQRVKHCYGYNGNESLDPTVTLKLMFLLFWENVSGARELMRQLPVRLDWLWFCELDLDSEIPDHSVLSKAKRRWGLETFEAIFTHVLEQCAAAGLIDATTTYADSTVLKANASVDSRVPRKLWEQLEESQAGISPRPGDDDDDGQASPPGRCTSSSSSFSSGDRGDRGDRVVSVEDTQADELPAPPQGKFNRRTVSATDPESATTSRRGREVKLGYRDHCLVDGRYGVVTATIATAADYDDAVLLVPLLNKHEQYLGHSPRRAVADSGYGTKQNIERLRWRGVQPYLKRRPSRSDHRSWLDRLPEECDRLLAIALMKRRLHTAEGRFAHAHVRHGHRRCRWRGRWQVQIQCYLVAMVQNIGKLVRYGRRPRPKSVQSTCQTSPIDTIICLTLRQRRRQPLHSTHLIPA